jgi:hypothetical protein
MIERNKKESHSNIQLMLMLMENKFHMVITTGCRDGRVHITMNPTENIEMP